MEKPVKDSAPENQEKVVVVLPAYNAASTLRQTHRDIPQEVVDQVILVDDCSTDNTVEVANELGLKVFAHSQNKGYGGNQKTCYAEALKEGAQIVVMLHPDYQYDPIYIPKLVKPIATGEADVVMGSRILGKEALRGGMPWWKFLGNRLLTFLMNLLLWKNFSEYSSGYRAFSRRVLETLPFEHNSDNFVFDSEMFVQALNFGFKIKEVPIPTRYFEEASSVSFKTSVIYGLQSVGACLKYLLHKWGLRKYPQFSRKENRKDWH